MAGFLDSLKRLCGGSAPARVKNNRRNAARHAAVENRARLSWWIGEENFDVPARVRDIGMLGASVIAEGQPPADHPLWLRFEEPCKTDWIEVKSVRNKSSDDIGVVFPHNCPYDVFKTLVPGCLLDGPGRNTIAREFDARYWR